MSVYQQSPGGMAAVVRVTRRILVPPKMIGVWVRIGDKGDLVHVGDISCESPALARQGLAELFEELGHGLTEYNDGPYEFDVES